MHITIAAIGKWKSRPERALYDAYVKRLPWKVTLAELEPKSIADVTARKQKEGELLLSACKNAGLVIALDERGTSLTSPALAAILGKERDKGARVAFVIGGADGLSDELRAQAHLLLSFGSLTWPHLLVRGLLAEQLYRAHSILERHPYHRA